MSHNLIPVVGQQINMNNIPSYGEDLIRIRSFIRSRYKVPKYLLGYYFFTVFVSTTHTTTTVCPAYSAAAGSAPPPSFLVSSLIADFSASWAAAANARASASVRRG